MPRRSRRPESYRRGGAQREPYDIVLIVCEGIKTERYYFEGLRRAWNLSSANIHVRHGGVTDPPNLVAYAQAEMEKGGFDRCFCVFDRDTHPGFQAALTTITQSPQGQAGTLSAVTSQPCFEIWVLLHFLRTTRAFVRAGGRSACDEVIREIKRHYGTYEKGAKDLFDVLAERLPNAEANAVHLSAHNQATATQNPSTGVHALVAYLRGLKR